MRRLPRQAVSQWADPRPRDRGRVFRLRSSLRIADVGEQLPDNFCAVAEVPLQGAVESGMVEPCQRAAHPARDLAKARDG